ncbi:molybdopterin-dependent oxidoreductase [Streptomyces sp. HNM0645]|uniref:xanthine dehydrogenase family protein molybdopterin-binding subunit n=1 Tax=Streptomyces sp. HNM0645 TaxID=2782343 RepID=UPI0024B7F507|nr:molybdopterin cofactor-binding domain-containing protein [Streptomyces sp. HNM0645]MDI9887273.1 molybdopterin-dependent oxidoreductase [Streptomyces sp. HNM0645]
MVTAVHQGASFEDLGPGPDSCGQARSQSDSLPSARAPTLASWQLPPKRCTGLQWLRALGELPANDHQCDPAAQQSAWGGGRRGRSRGSAAPADRPGPRAGCVGATAQHGVDGRSVSSEIYACPDCEGVYRLFRANTMTPTFMRAPGKVSGMFALECSMDELAHELGMDPFELRLRNTPTWTPCRAARGPAAVCGSATSVVPALRLVGPGPPAGHAPGGRPADRHRHGDRLLSRGPPANPQRARARLYADGTAVVQAATPDFGTGVTTVMTQVAADGLGMGVDRCRFENGDTDLPDIAAVVGSAGAGMISAAVRAAATALREQLIKRAVGDPRSPLHGADPVDVVVRDGVMTAGTASDAYADLLQRNFQPDAEASGQWSPPAGEVPYRMMTFGARFAEVAVDAELGLVRVRRMTGAFAPGRVLNAKTARSQLTGHMLWGLGQALLEANHMHPGTGRWANSSLGEYLVAVNADAPDVDVELIEVEDVIVNPRGVKGVGEIGQVGAAAAIANAVHHATGRRVRKLPIVIEDLL